MHLAVSHPHLVGAPSIAVLPLAVCRILVPYSQLCGLSRLSAIVLTPASGPTDHSVLSVPLSPEKIPRDQGPLWCLLPRVLSLLARHPLCAQPVCMGSDFQVSGMWLDSGMSGS